jgi:hypothetical protein
MADSRSKRKMLETGERTARSRPGDALPEADCSTVRHFSPFFSCFAVGSITQLTFANVRVTGPAVTTSSAPSVSSCSLSSIPTAEMRQMSAASIQRSCSSSQSLETKLHSYMFSLAGQQYGAMSHNVRT